MKILHNLLGILCGFALMIILLITSIELSPTGLRAITKKNMRNTVF